MIGYGRVEWCESFVFGDEVMFFIDIYWVESEFFWGREYSLEFYIYLGLMCYFMDVVVLYLMFFLMGK